MADRNEPVGARLGRGLRDIQEFYTATGERPAAGGAYTMSAEEELAQAQRAMQELQARRAARAAERAARPSMITNRPVGGNLAAAQPQAQTRPTMTTPTQPAAPAPAPRQPAAMRMTPAELEAERATMMEANQPPARPASRPRPRAAAPRGMSEADRLNEISLAFARGERPRGGAADTIGKAMGIEGYKKGGLIKPKKVVKKAAGGMLKTPKAPAAPGRGPGRPATSVKPVGTRAMAKAAAPKKPVGMPAFKKGGKVSMKKGKK
jgi:hypothetical protein